MLVNRRDNQKSKNKKSADFTAPSRKNLWSRRDYNILVKRVKINGLQRRKKSAHLFAHLEMNKRTCYIKI
jgi:hypothetical protein